MLSLSLGPIVCYTRAMSDFDLGWMIGILEGEGSFSTYKFIHKQTRNGKDRVFADHSSSIRVSNTDLEILDRLLEISQIGKISTKKIYSPLSKKEQFEWKVTRRNDLREFLPTIYPHMSGRRKLQIDKMLENLGSLV